MIFWFTTLPLGGCSETRPYDIRACVERIGAVNVECGGVPPLLRYEHRLGLNRGEVRLAEEKARARPRTPYNLCCG